MINKCIRTVGERVRMEGGRTENTTGHGKGGGVMNGQPSTDGGRNIMRGSYCQFKLLIFW